MLRILALGTAMLLLQAYCDSMTKHASGTPMKHLSPCAGQTGILSSYTNKCGVYLYIRYLLHSWLHMGPSLNPHRRHGM